MASGTWNTGSWSQNQWGDNANPTITVTGFALTNNLGTPTEVTGQINAGWGRFTWGEQAWGIVGTLIPTGISTTFNLGSVTTSADANTGPSTNNNQLLSAGLGSVIATGLAEVSPTGFALTNNLGTVDAGPDAMAVGIGATVGLGTVEAFNNEGWGRLGWGINDWGDAGSSIIASVTGISMTANLGTTTEISGDATIVANTLNVAQLTLGVVDPAPDAMIIGEAMIGSLGTLGFQGDVSPVPTGLPLTANLGSVTAVPSQEVPVTAPPMLARVASVTAFTDVTATFNGFPLTISVNNANALIWNDVPTGNAPIDPPGWTEVVA